MCTVYSSIKTKKSKHRLPLNHLMIQLNRVLNTLILIAYHMTREMSSLPRKNIDELMRRNYDLKKIEAITDGMLVRQNKSAPQNAFSNASDISVSDLFGFVKQNDKNFSPARF